MIANSWRSEEPSGRKEAHASGLMDSKQLYMVKWKETPLESFKNQMFDVEKKCSKIRARPGKGLDMPGNSFWPHFPRVPLQAETYRASTRKGTRSTLLS